MRKEISQDVPELDSNQVSALVELCQISKQQIAEGKGVSPEQVLAQLRAARK